MIYVIDDFYPNPDEVREKALELKYKSGISTLPNGRVNHPGSRATTNHLTGWYHANRIYLRNRWQQIVNEKTTAFTRIGSNCAFNLGLEDKENRFSWIHSDDGMAPQARAKYTMWACVIYLSPNPPPRTGTLLFENPNGSIYDDQMLGHKDEMKDKAKYYPPIRENYWDNPVAFDKNWKVHLNVANRYNRMVMYNGHMLHAPEDAGYGTTKETGRLTQIGFWFSEQR